MREICFRNEWSSRIKERQKICQIRRHARCMGCQENRPLDTVYLCSQSPIMPYR